MPVARDRRTALYRLFALPAVVLAALLLAAPAGAGVISRQASMDDGTFSGFDQTNAQMGTLTTSTEQALDGSYSAKATYSGGGSNGFARGVDNVSWVDGDDVYYGAGFYLPPGFKAAMQGEVDLMRWDNWTLDPNHPDRCGVVIYGSDKRGRFLCWQMGVSGSATALIGPFDIQEGQWNWIEVHQRIDSTGANALSQVWLNGQLVGSSTEANAFGREITRLRYGLVAMTDGAQTNPLTLYFDRAMISGSYIGPPAGSATTNQPPSVLLLDPTAGAAFDRQLYMEASASDDAGVAKVVFQVDGKAVATDTAAPYAYTWAVPRKLAYGGHTVTAVAYDSAGLTTASAPVSVTRAR